MHVTPSPSSKHAQNTEIDTAYVVGDASQEVRGWMMGPLYFDVPAQGLPPAQDIGSGPTDLGIPINLAERGVGRANRIGSLTCVVALIGLASRSSFER